MKLLLSSIQFSREDDHPGCCALRVRKNLDETCLIPEWQRGMFAGREDSRIAYAISDVQANSGVIAIKVRLLVVDPPVCPVRVFVRAVQPDIFPVPDIWNTYVNVLGEVEEHEIVIGDAVNTEIEVFTIRNHRLTDWGVGVFKVLWNWQFRIAGELLWTTFDNTEHKVYCLLKPPTAPWTQRSAGDLLLPWTDVLDYACDWAFQAKTEDQAAGNITKRLFSMGPLWFEYNCLNFLPAYVQVLDATGASFFNCMSFLKHLRFNNVNRYLICSDCAAIVSTFANILGCDLWQAKLQTPGVSFKVNMIFAIGGSRWQFPCNFPGFSYHEIAWTGNATAQDFIYDACLAIDGSVNPADSIRIPVLPLKMKLGRRGQGLYKDKLVAASDWQIARPNPRGRERRLPIPAAPIQIQNAVMRASRKSMLKKEITSVREYFTIEKPAAIESSGRMFSILDGIDAHAFPDWDISLADQRERSETAGFIFSTWRRRSSLHQAAKVDVYECESGTKAEELALTILVNSHTGVGAVACSQAEGTTTYTWTGSENVLMKRDNLVILVCRSDKIEIPARAIAQEIFRYFGAIP